MSSCTVVLSYSLWGADVFQGSVVFAEMLIQNGCNSLTRWVENIKRIKNKTKESVE